MISVFCNGSFVASPTIILKTFFWNLAFLKIISDHGYAFSIFSRGQYMKVLPLEMASNDIIPLPEHISKKVESNRSS